MRESCMRRDLINKIKNKSIVLFGAGKYARDFYFDFKDEFTFAYCVTNNEDEIVFKIDGKESLPVFRVDKLVSDDSSGLMVVLCAEHHEDMEKQLSYYGYNFGEEYITCQMIRLFYTDKRIALGYGVCDTRAICDCLRTSSEFINEYELIHFISYKEMKVYEFSFFKYVLQNCDLLIYNNFISRNEMIRNKAFISMIPKEVPMICVPSIGAALYHPQTISCKTVMNPYCVISSKSSWAPFTSPDDNINKLLVEGKTPSEILDIVSDPLYYEPKWLENNYRKELRRIQLQESMADIKISDFFEENRGKKRLMLNDDHVANSVLIELAKRVLDKLGFSNAIDEDGLMCQQLLYTSEVPLYPSVIKGLQLENYYDTPKYELFTFKGRQKVDFVEYVELYCDFCSGMIRYLKEGLFPI